MKLHIGCDQVVSSLLLIIFDINNGGHEWLKKLRKVKDISGRIIYVWELWDCHNDE